MEKPQYQEPHPIDLFEGAIGLSHRDIARSLGIADAQVIQKLRVWPEFETICKNHGFRFLRTAKHLSGPNGGRPGVGAFFDVNAGRFFVAKYDNPKGWGYLAFLLARSDAQRGDYKLLMQQLRRAEERAETSDNKAKAAEAALPRKNKHSIEFERTEQTLFGSETILVKKKLRLCDMNKPERRQWKVLHLSRISKGAAEKSIDVQTFKADG